MADVSSNDSFDESLDEIEEESVIESEDESENESEDEFESDEEIVTIPLEFERDGEKYEIQAITLASDRATSSVDYTGYFENITTLLFIVISVQIAFGMVLCFLLGVKK